MKFKFGLGIFLTAVLWTITSISCTPGGFLSGGSGSSNAAVIRGMIDFSADISATNNGFQLSVDSYVNTPDIISNRQAFVIGRVTNSGTDQYYSVKVDEGYYYIFAWMDINTNSVIDSGDLVRWANQSAGEGTNAPSSSERLYFAESTTNTLNIEMEILN